MLGRYLNVAHRAGWLWDGKTIFAKTLNVKFNGLANLALRFLASGTR